MTEQFKEDVRKYLEYHNEENKLKEKLNEIKNKKDQYHDNIIQFVETNNIQDKELIMGDFKLKYSLKKQTGTVTKKHTFDQLKKYFHNDENKANECLELIYSDRGSKSFPSMNISEITK